MAKICVDCGVDVSNARRVKDVKGNYFCQPCAQARAAKRHPAPAATAAAVPVAAAARAAAPPSDDGLYDLAEPEVAKTTEPMVACAECKRLVPERTARVEDGAFICYTCGQKRNVTSKSKPAGRAARPKPERDPNAVPFQHTLPGMAVCLGGTIVGSLVALSLGAMLNYSPVHAAIAGVIMFVICAVFSGLILLLMLGVGYMFGGMEFGNPATAIARALGLVVADQLLLLVLPHTVEGLQFVYDWGVRIALLGIGLMVLFGLEWIEGFISALAYYIITWLARIFLIVALVAATEAMAGARSSSTPPSGGFGGTAPLSAPGAP